MKLRTLVGKHLDVPQLVPQSWFMFLRCLVSHNKTTFAFVTYVEFYMNFHFFCCELAIADAPSQEVVFVRVLVKQLNLQILPQVVVNQGLETQTGAALRLRELNYAEHF